MGERAHHPEEARDRRPELGPRGGWGGDLVAAHVHDEREDDERRPRAGQVDRRGRGGAGDGRRELEGGGEQQQRSEHHRDPDEEDGAAAEAVDLRGGEGDGGVGREQPRHAVRRREGGRRRGRRTTQVSKGRCVW